MIDARTFKRLDELGHWLRQVPAQQFLKDLDALAVQELGNLLSGVCAQSTDPKVTAAYQRWKTLDDLAVFLREQRKETSHDDER